VPASSGTGSGTAAPGSGPGPEPVFAANNDPALLVAQLEDEVRFLRDELVARRREVQELHVLLAQRPALPAGVEISTPATNVAPVPWWSWQRWAWWRR
jgi:hypothetical protein